MKKLISLLLAFAMFCGLFAGCGSEKEKEAYVPTGDALLMEGQNPEDILPEDDTIEELTLAYYPDRSMNPLIGNNIMNRMLFSLMYQGLFASSSQNVSFPILCNRYRVNDDNSIYTFYVDPAARFTDGSRVTSDDVFATYQAARSCDYFKGRFTHIADIKMRDDGGITFYLDTPYQNLPLLLDIPILKAGAEEELHPVGSGPYYFSEGTNGTQLIRVENWWCDTKIATKAPVIKLLEASDQAQIRDEFEFGELDLAVANPMFDSFAEYRCDYELWEVENGVFLYLAFNILYSPYFKDSDVLRKAMTYAIDRESINANNYRGLAQPSTLPTSPGSPYYSPSLATRYAYDPMKFLEAIAGFAIPKDEKGQVKKLRLLVNADDSARLRAARQIADHLTELGIPTGVLEYGSSGPGTTYEQVLRAGTYDMYLGQTKLPTNYDLSEFFKGYGNVGYGGITSETLLNMTKEALSNSGNYYNLNQAVAESGLLCPVLFGCYNIYSERGHFLNLSPSRDNVFFYTIGKTMQSILERTDS